MKKTAIALKGNVKVPVKLNRKAKRKIGREIKFKDGSKPKYYSTNYSTTEDKFEILEYNRGREKGYNKRRVNGLKAKILSGDFFWDMSTIKVIFRYKKLWIIDGANRVTAVRELILEGKLPENFSIPFTEVRSPLLDKMNKKDLTSLIADLNDYDPRWTEDEHISAAIACNFPTALEYFNIKRMLGEPEYLKKREYVESGSTNRKYVTIPPNIILALAKKEAVKSNKKLVFGDFRDDSLATIMQSDEYMEEVDTFMRLIEIAKVWKVLRGVRTSKVYSTVLKIAYGENVRYKLSAVVDEIAKVKDKDIPLDTNARAFIIDLKRNIS